MSQAKISAITTSDSLAAFCKRHADSPYLMIDTEFLREQTYYPKVCLVQLAGPEEAVVVDALAPGQDLTLLRPLLADARIVKVFHAGRQDLEIFYNLFQFVPAPLFDTQLAAMVCGFGEQVAFDTLVRRITGESLDKMSRFTDWARRPLSERQLAYALADVVHLRPVYEALAKQLETQKRGSWIAEDLKALGDPALYRAAPDLAWQRIKVRSNDLGFLGRLKALAAWREEEAQTRDLPRQRLLKDEQLQEIAAHNPTDEARLAHTRGISQQVAQGKLGQRILATLAAAEPLPADEKPRRPERPAGTPPGPRVELLKVLLRLAAETHGVASRLIASGSDIDRLAAGETEGLLPLTDWRLEVFGNDALALAAGRLALASEGDSLRVLVPGPDGGWQERPRA
ncbi:MAG: ribonuclease D [Rhodospirillales bacterium]